jgi:hypothetical protein
VSFATLLNREVTIVPRTIGPRDGHGNPTFVDGIPRPEIRCRREELPQKQPENETEGEEQSALFLYFFGAEVAIDQFAAIVDGADRFEVQGRPHQVEGRRGRHHLEVTAEKVTG